MRRRVAVASALCGAPELVLLDEPLAGLDPSQAHSLRDRLAELRGRQTLVISSHNLAEIERLCDHVIMVQDGRCLRQGAMRSLTGADEVSRWQLARGLTEDALTDLRAALPEGARVVAQGEWLELHAPHALTEAVSVAMMGALHRHAIPLRGLTRGRGLERTFLDDQARDPA